MKKIIFALTSMIILTNCNSEQSLTTDQNNKQRYGAYDTSTDPLASASPTNIQLPELPTNPVFATFNNAYKTLAADNHKIGLDDPNNSDKYFFKVVGSATQTLDIAFFDIDDASAAQAILSAKSRGVNVRVVTDSDNLKDKVTNTLPRKAIEDFKAAGITVVDDKKSSFMHHKFMVIDNKAVWVGSTNLTTNSIYEHNNNNVYIQSAALATNYNTEFTKMFVNNDFGPESGQVPNPVVSVGDATIKTYFSPYGGTQQAVVNEIKKATKSIKFMIFAFTDQNIAQAMIDKKHQGINVEGIFDSCSINKYSWYYPLKDEQIPTYRDGNQALLHSKTIIIDDQTVITGSFNFSNKAETGNNEDTLIINSPSLGIQYLAEYDRLKFASLNNKDIPPYDHPACNHGNSLIGSQSVDSKEEK